MAASTVIKTLYDGYIKLRDGSPTPVELVVPFSVGDLKLDSLKRRQRTTAKYETRGVLRSVRLTSRIYATGSFTAYSADYSDATEQTVIDFLRQQGAYAGNISTLGATAEVYTIDIILVVEGTDLGDPADHTWTASDCDCTFAPSEGDPNSLGISFEILDDVSFT